MARVLAKILFQLDFLASETTIETSARGLQADFVGQVSFLLSNPRHFCHL